MIIVTLIISMGIILFLASKKVNIGYSLIIGGILLSLLNGRNVLNIFNIFLKTCSDYTTISLAVTITFITILGYLMEKYFILDRMMIALEKMLRSTKATILFAPSIIGTLLVTGGALMSCPVVDNLGERLNLSRDKKAAINLVFRHALYFIYPLSPTIILSTQIGNYNIWDFIKLQLPIALAMYAFGYIFLLKKCINPSIEKMNVKQYFKTIYEFIFYSSPILISLIGVLILNLPFYISLILGILLSISINLYDRNHDTKFKINESTFKTIIKGIKPSMIIAVLGIMFFKNIVNDINEIFTFLHSLLDMGVPLEVLILIASGIISFPLASIQPSIAILYPMILPLAPNYHVKLLYAMLIYTSSFVFYFISPLHMCQVLTLEYFDVKIKDLYKNYVYILPLIYLVMIAVYIVNML
ncbi:hypothetical protein CLTEP_20480 [Clostridium tepidiprofundi DSM 19306]|uniref:DUF401 family protein n=1 Tax=Clostridium tepidiprofundi DSM 19306 TaxID=1121338 RepID=A0A151B293_9CLOT|nr:DUF401 family protein [Clostridium tepidiprofundi]KYH33996.1 hypothetical protein CLTEP_20480 [Clostridium tepidiprofundi DSM 19306]